VRVITYSRVSTSHHDQRPEIQINALRKYCELREWAITEEIIDHGYSGGNDSRPGLKRLLALVRSNEVDIVVVLKLDRLFRSLKHLVTTLDEFQDRKIIFVAVKDNVDYSTPSGKLMTQILASMAEFEKSLLRERTMLGLEHARSKGIKLGRPKVRDDDKIMELRLQGCTYAEIQRKLGVSRGTVCRSIKLAHKGSLKP
jgi:DNA invertase Pin-like site-specific DNA recombinase